MIADPTAAKHVSDAMAEIFRVLDESYQQVEITGSPQDIAAYKRVIGHILSPVFVEVLNPLYRQHPALKPSDWDTESEKNAPTQT